MKNLRIKKTITYMAPRGLEMDIYYPIERREDMACILTLHSGGFVDGAKDDELQLRIIEGFLEKGFIVASADYTLYMRDNIEKISTMSKFRFFVEFPRLLRMSIINAIADLAMMIDGLYYSSEDLHINRDRIILVGSSAGAIAVLEHDRQRTHFAQKVAPYGWAPLAVIAFSGALTGNSDYEKYAIPAPTLLVHGTKDEMVQFGGVLPRRLYDGLCGSEIVRRKILKTEGSCKAVWFEGAGHEVSELMPEMIDEVTEFIDEVICGAHFYGVERCNVDLGEKAKKWQGKNGLELMRESLQ